MNSIMESLLSNSTTDKKSFNFNKKPVKDQIVLEKNFLSELFKSYAIFLKESGYDLTTTKKEVLSILDFIIEKQNIGSSKIVEDVKLFILKQFMPTNMNVKQDIADKLDIDTKTVDMFINRLPRKVFDKFDNTFSKMLK